MKKFLCILAVIFVFCTSVIAVDVVTQPEIPGNSIDDDHNGTIDGTVPDVWTADSSDYWIEAENCQYTSPIVQVLDTIASNGAYLGIPSNVPWNSAQIRCQHTFTNATYAGWWVRARVLPGARRMWCDSSPIALYPNNATKAFVLTQSANFTWYRIGTTGSNANFVAGTNATAERGVALNGQQAISCMIEPGIDVDRFALSPTSQAGGKDPSSIGGAPPPTVQYDIYNVGAGSLPTIDGTIDAAWSEATTVSYSGTTDAGFAGAPVTKCLWKSGTPDRMACLHTYNLAGLLSTTTTDDNTASVDDTGIFIYLRTVDLVRSRTSDTYLFNMNFSSPPVGYDANWPAGSFSTTFDFANVSRARSYTTNTMVIEVAFDLPSDVTAGQQVLVNFMAAENTGSGAQYKQAFTTGGDPSDPNGWGTGRFSSTTISGADVTAPTVNSCSAVNTANVSFDAQCSTNEAGTVIVKYDTDNDNAVSGADMVTVQGGTCSTTCTVNISGLTAGTAYEWQICVTDAAGNQGCSAVQDTTTSSGNTFYVSTGGSGTTCSNGSPCAITRINVAGVVQPGDTWIVKDGTYTGANRLNLRCDQGVLNGTPSAPITVRAENERLAFIQTDGTVSALFAIQCNYWTFQGLRMEGANNAGQGAATASFFQTGNITFRRNLVRFSNAYFNEHLVTFDSGSGNHVVEENEIYSFHRHGLDMKDNNAIVRRNYCNKRGYVVPPGGYPGGGGCFTAYPSSGALFENNVAEGTAYDHEGISSPSNVRFLGNIAANTTAGNAGTFLECREDPSYSTDPLFRDHVILNSVAQGFYGKGAKNLMLRNVTIVGSTGDGLLITADSSCQSLWSNLSFSSENLLITGSGAFGVHIDDATHVPSSSLDYTNTFNNTSGNSIGTGTNTNATTTDPNLGGCYAFIRSASPMKGTGKGGADLGATVLYAYENGTLNTSKKLWNSGTNQWSSTLRGATISGVNDTDGLVDFGSRFHPSCASWPGGY